MRTIAIYLCLFLCYMMCSAKEITIFPQFSVGDTLRYRTTAEVRTYHENDSVWSTLTMFPQIIVESKNEKGFIISTSNKLESFESDCSNPDLTGLLPNPEDLNNFLSIITLRIQLDSNCRPDTILNLDEIKEMMFDAFADMFAKQQGIDIENSAEWRMDTKPLLMSAVSAICNQKHLIEEQFCNIPFFNFIGIPLKSGKIPSSMVLTDEMQRLCNVKELKMKVEETNYSDDFMGQTIYFGGKKEKTKISGGLLLADGILSNGYIRIDTELDTEKSIQKFVIESIY